MRRLNPISLPLWIPGGGQRPRLWLGSVWPHKTDPGLAAQFRARGAASL